MKKIPVLTIFILSLLMLGTVISCSGGGDSAGSSDDDNGPIAIIPSNLTLSINIVGADGNNPNGDGSGIIQCTASATDALKYGFRFDSGDEIESFSGNLDFTFTNDGTINHTVSVFAYSSTNHSISTFETITVYVADNGPQLTWSDEFNTNGAPDSSKWGYDIGDGCPDLCGWGNGESQYYTSRPDNVIVEDGVLKITAKRENYEGSDFTSARILTLGKYNFTYGRVEISAKLPSGGGTWPALWMLGSNISTAGWPACGEADIMEHVGNNQGTVSSAMHTPSSSGNTVNHGDQYLADVSSAFHVYSVDWSSEEMVFSIDDVVHYTYNPAVKNNSTWPFDANMFFIFNIAMGGSFGGNIDQAFTESTMEIDYVRVYQ